jgi:hypothetical protein
MYEQRDMPGESPGHDKLRDMLEDRRQQAAVDAGAVESKTPDFIRFSHHHDDGILVDRGTTQFAIPLNLLGREPKIIYLECVIGDEAETMIGEDLHYNMEPLQSRWNIKSKQQTTEC